MTHEQITKWKTRDFSWSQLSSWEYDKEQWYKRYILDERDEPSKEMLFGRVLADALEHGTCEIPELVKRLPFKKEHPFKVKFGALTMVGYADDFDDKTFTTLNEVKTGKRPWDQKRVDEHGQLTMYCLLNYITNKVRPEDVEIGLHWLPTRETGDFTISFTEPVQVISFKTKRTMQDILKFGSKINSTYKEMEEYCKVHK
jgi:hypothetical protein